MASDEVDLQPTGQSVSLARKFLQRRLPRWLRADGRDRLLLAASEVVTNAIQASGRTVTLRMLPPRHPTVRVEVDDENPATALTVTHADLDAEGGRGLFLVEEVSDGWGVTNHPDDGKTVWFNITEPSARTEPSTGT